MTQWAECERPFLPLLPGFLRHLGEGKAASVTKTKSPASQSGWGSELDLGWFPFFF